MTGWIQQIPYRRSLFAAFTFLVLGDSGAEIVSEISAGEPLLDMIDDLLMFAVSGIIILLFGIEYFARLKSTRELQGQLDKARGQLAQLDGNSARLASQYRDVMQKQFDQWRLTAGEQDVVLALLKGLSFREVAELRQTREKTVRQQATSVYRKAGVAGRHELAAWFFEDMLEPPEIAGG